MRTAVLSLLTCLLLTGCACGAAGNPQAAEEGERLLQFPGTVVFVPLEGGFYGIIAGDGSRYDPAVLPEAFRQDGLPVQVTARRLEGSVGFHMWGAKIEIVDIRRLEPGSDLPPR